MPTISATELARNTSAILNRVTATNQAVDIERNRTIIARIVPPVRMMTVAEALAGLANTLSPEEGAEWLKDSRNEGPDEFDQSVRDPWE